MTDALFFGLDINVMSLPLHLVTLSILLFAPELLALVRPRPIRKHLLGLKGNLQEDILVCFKNGPFLCTWLADSSISIGSNVTFANDLIRFKGSPEYAAQARESSTLVAPALQGYKFFVERVSPVTVSVKDLSFAVQWNATFIPESIQLLALLSKLPGLRSEFFNILDREGRTTTFSWDQLRRFCAGIITTGVVKLPHAVIKGQTEITFHPNSENKGYVLMNQNEKINLVEAIKVKRLKNRVLVGHLLEYLSARRPNSITFEEWEDIIFNRIDYRSVKGMGQFDIDGISGEQQQDILSASSRVLGYSTAVVLSFGFILAFNLLNTYLHP